MASLSNRNAVKYRHLGQDDEGGPEKPQAETLRDKILKGYLQKQMKISGSVAEYRQVQRDFCRASVEESITKSTQGLTSFEDFKKFQSSLTVKEVLRSSGLSEEDIKILQSQEGETSLDTPAAREERLRAIKEKLEFRQNQLETLSLPPEQFSGAVPLNRHDFEEEINSLPTNERANKLTACLVRLQPHVDDSIPADHPINHIKEIAEELFPSNIDEKREESKSKKRKSDCLLGESDVEEKSKGMVKHVYLTEKPKSLWDMKEIPKIIKSGEPKTNVDVDRKEKRVCLFIRKEEKTIKHDPSRPFVLSLDDSDLVPLEKIKCNRKTLEELREMDKFKNLEEGEPSKTLYLKNLSHKTSPNDLVSVLGHFESKSGPKILYRILNGRMRGQAFVTFQDKDTATWALQTCNGFILNEKPLVMEYSKK